MKRRKQKPQKKLSAVPLHETKGENYFQRLVREQKEKQEKQHENTDVLQ